MSKPYNVLVGVGTLYVAPAGTAAPLVSAEPAVAWVSLGETEGGVKVTKTQNIESFSSDQRTGKLKAVRTEEGVTIEANLTTATLENLANVMSGTVTITPPGVAIPGIRTLQLHSGAEVNEYAFLFRGTSPYGVFPGQFYVPRGYLDDDIEMEFTKDGMTLVPCKFEALEDLVAATEADRFGVVTYQDLAPTS